MNAAVFFIGLIILVVGVLYLLPIMGMNLIPFVLPSFGIDPLMLGGGLAVLGFIILAIGIHMM